MGPRLIIVSNRVAVPDPPGAPLAGGMAVAVKAALKSRAGLWFGWSGAVTEEPTGEPRIVEINKVRVPFSRIKGGKLLEDRSQLRYFPREPSPWQNVYEGHQWREAEPEGSGVYCWGGRQYPTRRRT